MLKIIYFSHHHTYFTLQIMLDLYIWPISWGHRWHHLGRIYNLPKWYDYTCIPSRGSNLGLRLNYEAGTSTTQPPRLDLVAYLYSTTANKMKLVYLHSWSFYIMSMVMCKEKKVLKALSDLSMEGSIAWKESFFIDIKATYTTRLGYIFKIIFVHL